MRSQDEHLLMSASFSGGNLQLMEMFPPYEAQALPVFQRVYFGNEETDSELQTFFFSVSLSMFTVTN